MGYGNAVLTSDIPENLEAIKNKGVTFRSGDVNDLYEKMLGLIDNFSRVNSLKKSIEKGVSKRMEAKVFRCS